MLSKPKLALLRVAKSQLALDEEDYRAALLNYGGSASASELDTRGFDAVMDRFRVLGFVSSSRERGYGPRVGMASPAQIELIRELWGRLAREPTEAGLNTWLSHFGVSALRFLDAARAPKVIGALRKWEARL